MHLQMELTSNEMSVIINKKMPVLVTGSTGYVAGWIIKKLLEEGLTVHACVRNPNNKEKLKHLEKLQESTPGNLKYFKTDLLQEGSFNEAMLGCSIVFHTASPFILKVKDPQKDLVDPAKLGTRNVLETASRTASVERVVLTSSVVAVYGDNIDILSVPKGVLTEENWNFSSTLNHNPYPFSKTLAEREAWEICSNQKQWDLVALNPGLVFGPSLSSVTTSESFNIMRLLIGGPMKAGAPNIEFGVVDVRDLADAHFKAAFIKAASGRYIISGHNTSFIEIANSLLPKYKKYPLPRRTLPKFLLWLVGPYVDSTLTRKYISCNVNYPFRADSSKSITELNIKYRPLKETVTDMLQEMIDNNQISNKD